MDTVFIQAAKTSEFQWGFQLIGAALGLIVIGVLIPIAVWLIKKGIDRSQKNKEDISIIKKLTETHVLVKDTREDVKEMKMDMSDIKKTQKDHEKRLTGLEKEHKMYSRSFHCKSKTDKTKEMTYIRVLVVDDQQEFVDYMIDYFHNILPGKNGWNRYVFQVDGVNSYDDGVVKIDSGKYHLGLYDVMLSKTDPRDGFLLAKYSLKNGLNNFFVCSADKELKNIPREFAERFLVKPSSNEEWKVFENRLEEMV